MEWSIFNHECLGVDEEVVTSTSFTIAALDPLASASSPLSRSISDPDTITTVSHEIFPASACNKTPSHFLSQSSHLSELGYCEHRDIPGVSLHSQVPVVCKQYHFPLNGYWLICCGQSVDKVLFTVV